MALALIWSSTGQKESLYVRSKNFKNVGEKGGCE